MTDPRSLYEQVILDHNRSPRNYGELEQHDVRVEGVNPLCGDEFTLYFKFDGEKIVEVKFVGHGCAISKSSASLMTTLVKGKNREEALLLFDAFHDMLQADKSLPLDEKALGKLAVFSGVREYPMRIKCAMLAWHTLKKALSPVEP